MRYALGIEYDGSAFFGWQIQRESPTVQEVLQNALSHVANEPVRAVCAGRTDTGVHALCQVAHFDTSAVRDERSWVLGVNSNLPKAACVRWVRPVADDFHARFTALARHYRYEILNRWVRPAIGHGRVSWIRKPLDEQAMNEAAQTLLGEHDFTSFRSSGCKANHPVREVQSIGVRRDGDRLVLEVSANGFLYHMVRNIAGSLIEVGAGERSGEWLAEILSARDRTLAGVTAPPDGLYFMGVRYPPGAGLPSGLEAFPPASGSQS